MTYKLFTSFVAINLLAAATAAAQSAPASGDPAAESAPATEDHSGDAAAEAVEARSKKPSMLSVMGKFGYLYAGNGYGAALRYRYSVVPKGFIKSGAIRDDFGIEGGVDYTRYDLDLIGTDWALNLVEVSATATWNVWFTDKFAAYPRAGLGFGVASLSGDSALATPVGYGGIYGVGGIGMLYDLGGARLRAEVNNRELSLGAALTF